MHRTSTIVINKEKRWFVARSLELGVVSQGKTVEAAKRNVLEAIELYFEDMPGSRKYLSAEPPLVTAVEIGG